MEPTAQLNSPITIRHFTTADTLLTFLKASNMRSGSMIVFVKGNGKNATGELHLVRNNSLMLPANSLGEAYVICAQNGLLLPWLTTTARNFLTLSKKSSKSLSHILSYACTKPAKDEALLFVAFSYLNRYMLYRNIVNSYPEHTRKSLVYQKFVFLVAMHYKDHHDAQFYSGKLCITTGYLTKIVKAVGGTTTKGYIVKYIIEEAIVLLLTTELTIEAIALHIGFKEASPFSVIFKKYTGSCPQDFRRITAKK